MLSTSTLAVRSRLLMCIPTFSSVRSVLALDLIYLHVTYDYATLRRLILLLIRDILMVPREKSTIRTPLNYLMYFISLTANTKVQGGSLIKENFWFIVYYFIS